MGEKLLFALLIAAFASVFFQIGRRRTAFEDSRAVPPDPIGADPGSFEKTRVEPSFSSKVVPPDPSGVEPDSSSETATPESAPSPPHPMVSAKIVKFLVRQGTECTVGFTDAAGHDLVTRTSTVPTGLDGMEGEYLGLTIDMETGQVLNWQRPSDQALQRFYDWQAA